MTVHDTAFAAAALPAHLARFGEQITLLPPAAASRTVTAIVKAIVADSEEADVERKTETLEVTMLRDEADADYGGLADEADGLRLVRAEAETSEAAPFAFTGDVLTKTSVLLRLRFVRPRTTRIGRR